jgi:hypothetical protein
MQIKALLSRLLMEILRRVKLVPRVKIELLRALREEFPAFKA